MGTEITFGGCMSLFVNINRVVRASLLAALATDTQIAIEIDNAIITLKQ
jgi:hypothetical protein